MSSEDYRSEESKEQKRQYKRVRNRELRRIHYARCITFLGGVCVVCGSTDSLEISHNVPSLKSFDPGDKWSADWDTVVRPELDGSNGSGGCSIRCDPCHTEYDKQLKWGPEGKPPHNTYARYMLKSDPCRCLECVEAHNKYHRDLVRERRATDPQSREAYNKYMRERRANDPVVRTAHAQSSSKSAYKSRARKKLANQIISALDESYDNRVL